MASFARPCSPGCVRRARGSRGLITTSPPHPSLQVRTSRVRRGSAPPRAPRRSGRNRHSLPLPRPIANGNVPASRAAIPRRHVRGFHQLRHGADLLADGLDRRRRRPAQRASVQVLTYRHVPVRDRHSRWCSAHFTAGTRAVVLDQHGAEVLDVPRSRRPSPAGAVGCRRRVLHVEALGQREVAPARAATVADVEVEVHLGPVERALGLRATGSPARSSPVPASPPGSCAPLWASSTDRLPGEASTARRSSR